jgi:hypothetical protein
MESEKLVQSNLVTQCLSFISKARVIMLAGGLAKRLTSMLVMLVFTVSAAVVLVVSVVFLTAQSVVGAVLPRAIAIKKGCSQDLLWGDRLSPRAPID